MKKIILSIVTGCMLSTINPPESKATVVISTDKTAGSKYEPPTEVEALLLRLNEIKAIDKSNLKAAQKKELRKEVRTIREELKHHGYTRVYISGAALIIIILLLIILI